MDDNGLNLTNSGSSISIGNNVTLNSLGLVGPDFTLDSSGLSATNANISGEITATTGSVTGTLTIGTSGKITNGGEDYRIDEEGLILNADPGSLWNTVRWQDFRDNTIYVELSSYEGSETASGYQGYSIDVFEDLIISYQGTHAFEMGVNTQAGGSGDGFWYGDMTIQGILYTDQIEPYNTSSISSTSNFYANDFQTGSDRRIKNHIYVIEDILSIFDPINLYSFQKEGKDNKEIGLIAQEVQEGHPLLTGTMNHEEYGEILTLSAHSIASLAVGGVKELNTKVDSEVQQLKNKVSRLEDKIETLESQK